MSLQSSFSRHWYLPANMVSHARLLLCWVPGAIIVLSPRSGEAWIWWLVAAIAFGVIAATDALDGYLARSRNEITEWGTFIDPLVDKFLIVVTMCFISAAYAATTPKFWVATAIIALREVIVTLTFRTGGKSLPAGLSGKVKMILQVAMVVSLLVPLNLLWSEWGEIQWVITVAAVTMTLYSWMDYWSRSRA